MRNALILVVLTLSGCAALDAFTRPDPVTGVSLADTTADLAGGLGQGTPIVLAAWALREGGGFYARYRKRMAAAKKKK